MDEEEIGEEEKNVERTKEPIGVYSEEEISPDTKPSESSTPQPVKVVAKKTTLNSEEEIESYVKDAVDEDELDNIFYNKGKEEEEIVEDYDPSTPLTEEVVSPEQAANLAQIMMGGKTEPVKVDVKATKTVVNADSSDDDLDVPIKTFN